MPRTRSTRNLRGPGVRGLPARPCGQAPYEWSGQKSLPLASITQPWPMAQARTLFAPTGPG